MVYIYVVIYGVSIFRGELTPKKYHFDQNGGSFPLVSEEYVHNGRLHTRTNNGVFKKPSVMT